ncbi:hypothetical protein MPH_03624 [Macrophomina phaseolina MS6]|uniref:Uncharacterized protein n=1 Tax=Macrophomina phaseolina (strain MS6) TaxID=1126212 RepID=K2RWH5_MACPH|nr:hypothetical protein MPH_03624 [Macrophomina phaseolina MS6]
MWLVLGPANEYFRLVEPRSTTGHDSKPTAYVSSHLDLAVSSPPEHTSDRSARQSKPTRQPSLVIIFLFKSPVSMFLANECKTTAPTGSRTGTVPTSSHRTTAKSAAFFPTATEPNQVLQPHHLGPAQRRHSQHPPSSSSSHQSETPFWFSKPRCICNANRICATVPVF